MKLLESYYIDIEKQLLELFKEIYFIPLIELFEKNEIENSSSALLNALRHGRIIYSNSEFTGKFTIQISKELSRFSEFDNRSKSFKVKDVSKVPNDVLITSFYANEKSKKIHEDLNRRIKDMPAIMQEKLKTMKFSIEKSSDEIESALRQDFKKIGIEYNPSGYVRERLDKEYNYNMNLNVKNWNDEQVSRLHEMIEKSALEGYRRDTLIQAIQNEFGVADNKAKFLARQETSIYMSTLRDSRYIDSNVNIYKFSTSHDQRVRESHKIMNGKICRFDDNTLYAENIEKAKKNMWIKRSNIDGVEKHPGYDYNCRCVAIPILL